MKLVADWRRVLRHAWSVHLTIAAALVALIGAADTAWPFLDGIVPVSPTVFALIAGVLSFAATLSRFVYQPEMHDGE